ncbi:MAG TPA: hypothetical protein VFM13_05555 [Gaiellaceae bacterium]|nr:hypothetical protein [Gaiellaceae bacterium]
MSAVAVDSMVEEIELWELHSELVLVSPEVCRRALELMPERDPEAFLDRPRDESEAPARVALALRYALWRCGQSARFALAVTVAAVGLALIAEMVH